MIRLTTSLAATLPLTMAAWLFISAVENEDNWVCAKIQQGLASGGNHEFVFGKNELGLHRLHDTIDYYLGSPSAEALGLPAAEIDDRTGQRELGAQLSRA